MVYRIKFICEEVDGFVREVKIDSEASFLDLNKIILESCGYPDDQMTSFYLCNDEWERGEQVTREDMGLGDSDEDIYVMDSTRLSELIEDEEQRLEFVFDPFNNRSFYLDVKELIPGEHLDNAEIVRSKGNAPQQIEGMDDDPVTAITAKKNKGVSTADDDYADDDADYEDDYYEDDYNTSNRRSNRNNPYNDSYNNPYNDRDYDRRSSGRKRSGGGVKLAAPIKKGGKALSRLTSTLLQQLSIVLILVTTAFVLYNFYRASTPYGDIQEAIQTQKLSQTLAAYLCVAALFLFFEFISLLWSMTRVRVRDGVSSWREDTGRGLWSFILVFAVSYAAFLFSPLLPDSPEVVYGVKGALDVYGSLHNVLFGLCAAGVISCLIRKYKSSN